MKKYEALKIEIHALLAFDVITTSVGDGTEFAQQKGDNDKIFGEGWN